MGLRASAHTSGPQLQVTVADLVHLSKEAPGKEVDSGLVAKMSVTLAQKLRVESSSFRSTDVVQVIGACCRLTHSHAPLLEAIAAHVMRGMAAYPLYALCSVSNGFARLSYFHRQLLDAIANFMVESERADQLSPVDIASLVYAYAQFGYSADHLLEACADRLKVCYAEVSGQNCAIILNSYARLNICDSELYRLLSHSVLETMPESFEVHHVSIIMNAFARCRIRNPQLMQTLGGFLEGRVQLLSPQNLANAVNALAMVSVHHRPLFRKLQARVATENLHAYKLFELTMLVHGLTKLQCRDRSAHKAVCGELVKRDGWDPQAVAQVLDVLRRDRALRSDALTRMLLEHFFKEHPRYGFHSLTQAARCITELDVFETAHVVPSELLPVLEEETPRGCLMRLVLERVEELHTARPLTVAQTCSAQNLVRAYHYRNELDYSLLPHRTKAFCKSLFDVPSSLVTSVSRSCGRSRGKGPCT